MSRSLSKYAFINAKLRARISKILPDESFTELAKAPSLDAALILLQETPFARLEEVYSKTGDMKQAELELLKDEIDLYKSLRQYLHPNSLGLIEALLTRFEIDNLKNAIRIYFERKIRNQSPDADIHYILYDRIIHDIPIDIVVNAESFDEIAGACEGTPYSQIIKKYSHTVESEGSLFRLEIGLDHFYYENLLIAMGQLDRRDREIALRLTGVEIDLQNINWIIRFKNFYNLDYPRKVVTIEPVLDFDILEFSEWIIRLHKQGTLEYVWFGFDSKNCGLLEPTIEKAQTFVNILTREGIEVRGKTLRDVTLPLRT